MGTCQHFPNSITSRCLSVCRLVILPLALLLVLVQRPANWRGYRMFSQRRAITDERERARERETERTREHVNGDRGMIFGQLYNWLFIQCTLHIRDSSTPSTPWLIRCSQNVVTVATKINLSHNENVSWQLTLLFFLSLSFPPLCLSLLLAFFFFLITSWQPRVSLSVMLESDVQWLRHASAYYFKRT